MIIEIAILIKICLNYVEDITVIGDTKHWYKLQYVYHIRAIVPNICMYFGVHIYILSIYSLCI